MENEKCKRDVEVNISRELQEVVVVNEVRYSDVELAFAHATDVVEATALVVELLKAQVIVLVVELVNEVWEPVGVEPESVVEDTTDVVDDEVLVDVVLDVDGVLETVSVSVVLEIEVVLEWLVDEEVLDSELLDDDVLEEVLVEEELVVTLLVVLLETLLVGVMLSLEVEVDVVVVE